MTSALEINGKLLQPVKQVARATSYSRDYITRLAREGKVVASHVGRQWFVDADSLKRYAKDSALEREIRKRQLSAERKRERQLREVVNGQRTLHHKKARTLRVRAVVATTLILGCGLLSGAFAYQYILPATVQLSDLAQATLLAQRAPSSTLPSSVEFMPAGVSGVTTVLPAVDQATVAQSTHTERPLGDITEGVLLLPQAGKVKDLPAFFSDQVAVRQLADGTEVVVRVDATGQQIGNEVPFVVVPVTSDTNI